MKLFQSFFMAGYECADLINRSGERIDILSATGHDERAAEDYNHLVGTGIKTVREGIRWSQVEKKPFVYDFTEVLNRMEAAKETEVQQLWDLCHFGYPDDLFPTHPKFSLRFSALCYAFAKFYKEHSDAPLVVTPINEIGFLSWYSGEVKGTVPFVSGSSADIRYNLCKASIEGIQALLEVIPGTRILLSESLIKIHPREGEPLSPEIQQLNEEQYMVTDMIGGYKHPELGGNPQFLDILGFNFFPNCQREHKGDILPWHPVKSSRWVPFSILLHEAYMRYKKPILISGTGHVGENRPEWLNGITNECISAMLCGVDLLGICLSSAIEKPMWDKPDVYLETGLWDLPPDKESRERILNQPYLDALIACQYKMSNLEYLKGARAIHPGETEKVSA
jgi:hypothetical protein